MNPTPETKPEAERLAAATVLGVMLPIDGGEAKLAAPALTAEATNAVLVDRL